MNSTLCWNAIYVRSNAEKRVSKLLDKKGIVYYCPQRQAVADSSHQKGLSFLFPSVIFVQSSDSYPVAALAKLPDVNNVMYWQQLPATFPPAEIDLMRHFLEAYGTVQLTKIPLQPYGENFSEQSANLHSFSADNIHTINLPSIGYSLSAKAEPVTSIKLVQKKATGYRATGNFALFPGFKTNKVS